MARRTNANAQSMPIESIAHDATRANIPTVDGQEFVTPEVATPTVERWDKKFRPDEPVLAWRGKADQPDHLEVTTPPIYIQEKIDARALVEDLRRTAANPKLESEPTLFDDFDGLDDWQSVEYYQHQAHWSNRMILGDSLSVMSSLANRESLRGQVQAIYIDPPYGIKFGSNWQPRTDKRDVKDGNLSDLAREVEQIKAFRDTWEDGVNTYLTYLRDRLLVTRELLTESGSCFVQIGDENVHLVRALMDEVFGAENFVSQISFTKTAGATSRYLATTADYIIWFSKNIEQMKYRPLFRSKVLGGDGASAYNQVELADGSRRPLTKEERIGETELPPGARIFRYQILTSPRIRAARSGYFPVSVQGREFLPTTGEWKTNLEGMNRLAAARRAAPTGRTLSYVRFIDDFPAFPLGNTWDDTQSGSGMDKIYVVQTNARVIERCLLMTTDPGDLVLDPTCGSGTTAFVAEQWARRWITIDTSRVAIALARQRLMAARYPYYFLADSPEGAAKVRSLGHADGAIKGDHRHDVRQGFVYERVPHVTLKSIANNPDIHEGMPREEIDAVIARHAETETLHDRPLEDRKRIRVSGRFTVESLSPHRSVTFDPKFPGDLGLESTDEDGGVSELGAGGSYEQTILDNLETAGVQNGRRNERLVFTSMDPHAGQFVQAVGTATTQQGLAAEKAGEVDSAATQQVAISLGPEYGTVDARLVKAATREALKIRGVETLVVTGYAFEANALDAASEAQEEARNAVATVAGERRLGHLTVLLVRMNIDLAMGDDLLKNTDKANLFTVFGEPDIDVSVTSDGVVVSILGIDVYDPTTGKVRSGSTNDIALWMIDTDYDEEKFFVRHAYFSGAGDPYKKLRVSLKAEIDEDAWASLYSTVSRPFPVPSTGKIAVKAINIWGDEVLVMREVH